MKALESSENKFKTLVNTLPDYVWLKDVEGVYLACNTMFEEFVGKKEAEIIGKTDYDLFDKEISEYYLKKDQEAMRANGPVKNEDKIFRAIDQQAGLLETTKIRMNNEDGSVLGILGVGHDITERKAREEQIEQSLLEKETLLRELYHRTKNNMQLIISMLLMRERVCEDEVLKGMIKDIKFKINSMSLVHQKLYQSKDLSKINLNDYIRNLAKQISASYSLADKQISLQYDLQDVFCLIDTAIPLGLVINELVTNAFKYAWPEVSEGVLKIGLKVDSDGSIIFTLADDGIGFAPEFELDKNKSLGLETVIMLGRHQLDGELDYKNNNGLIWRLKFKDNLYKERV